MSLSNDLLSQFAKLTNNKSKQTTEYTVYGTVKASGDSLYVQLDGSEILTPVESTTVGYSIGDRVAIKVKNHTLTVTGNVTFPAASESKVNEANNRIDSSNNTIIELNNTINQQNNTITEINNKVLSQGNTITEINNNVNSQGNTITEIGNTVKSQGNTITEINNTVKSQGNSINLINNRIDSQDSIIETIGSTVTTHDSEIEILNSAFVIKDGVLTGLNTIIVDDLITNRLDANYVKTDTLEANYVKTATLEANYVKTATLKAEYATIANLNAAVGRIGDLESDYVTVNNLLTAHEGVIKTLNSTYATIAELNAAKADIGDLDADVADINTLIFGSATGTSIQTSFANAVIAHLGNAQIKSAMIDSVSADKITALNLLAGTINSGNVTIESEDGSLVIADETIQISDDTRVRVQIGKDDSGDYSINIWDAEGKLMFSEGGLTEDAIKESIIRNDMVASDAAIDAGKLDIDSLFSEINGSSNTIKSSKVYLDKEKQTLDVAFTSIITDVDELSENVSSQGTAISVIQDRITSKIWQQDINEATDAMSTQYSTLVQDLGSFKTTVGATYATIEDFNSLVERLSTAETTISQNTTDILLRATLTEVATAKSEAISSANQNTSDLLKNYSTTSQMNAAINLKADSITSTVSQTYTTKTEFSGRIDSAESNILTVTQTAQDLKARLYKVEHEGTDYMEFGDKGLIVGDMIADTLGNNVLIDSDSIDIRNGDDTLASFQKNSIELGFASEESQILLCGMGVLTVDEVRQDEDHHPFGYFDITSKDKLRLTGSTINLHANFESHYNEFIEEDADESGQALISTGISSDNSPYIKLKVDHTGNYVSSDGQDVFKTTSSFFDVGITTSQLNSYGKILFTSSTGNIELNAGTLTDRGSKYLIRAYSRNFYLTEEGLDMIGDLSISGNIYIKNNRTLYSYNTDGEVRHMINLNTNNNLVIGYGGYNNSEGTTNLYGNAVNIISKGNIALNGAVTFTKAAETRANLGTFGVGYDSIKYNTTTKADEPTTVSYPGLTKPNGSSDTYVRTGQDGLLPYRQASTAMSSPAHYACNVGTQTWPFDYSYVKTGYFNYLDVSGVLINSSSNIVLPNNKSVYSKWTVDGAEVTRSMLFMNSAGECVLGYGGWSNNEATTRIYGKAVHVYSKTLNTNFQLDATKPYYAKGDSITTVWWVAGFVPTTKTNLHFTVPLAKPVIGNPTVTVTSNSSGLTVRQNGTYIYGSSSGATPNSYSAELNADGNAIKVTAIFGNSTNVTSHHPCSVSANIKITFS